MSIIGVTVGTPISPEKIEEKINPVKTVNGKSPDENGNVVVEVNANITETDPTVPSWAKQSTKPSYTKSEVGLGNVDNVKQYSASNPPPYPVTSVNSKTGAVTLAASDVGARPSTWTPTYSDVGADKGGTAENKVSAHNTNATAHNDLRLLIEGLTTRLNALANSDDTTLDQMKEIVDYIKSNRDLIQGITTTKINYTDIINDLATNVADKPLSAAQGVVLKALIDKINDAGYLTSFTEKDPTVPSWAKQTNKPNYTAEEVGAVSLDGLADAINIALATAKESGEFDGNDGVGILKIEKTSTNGRIDTYTITLTNGTTSTFTVTNSKDDEGGNIDLSELFTVDKISTVDNYAAGTSDTKIISDGIRWQDTISFGDGADFYQEVTGLFKVPLVAGKNIAFERDGNVVKINLAEVINNLTTNSTDKPLSAAQGVALKALIDALPSWAKEANKPSYTPSEVGAVPTSRTVNGKALSSNISLSASDVGADASGAASSAVSAHNTNTSAHNDLRLLIEGLTARLDALANSTDDDLDQMAEIVTYIKANKELIDSITTSKVSVADIVNNLTSNVTNKPLSAAQGVALKKLIDAITVPTKVSQLDNDSGFLTQHQDLSAYAKTANHYNKTESDNKYQAKGNYLTSVPSEYVTETELNNKGYLTSHQDISGKADKSSAETWTFKLKDGSTVTKKVVLA
jgi:hemerythrin-like domain-containing protein